MPQNKGKGLFKAGNFKQLCDYLAETHIHTHNKNQ